MQTPILVTGAPRSGTTFVGKMLCLPSHMAYLDEPFNVQTGMVGIERPLVYISSDTPELSDRYLRLMRALLAGRGQFRPSRLPTDTDRFKRAARELVGSRSQRRYRSDVLNPWRTRWLIKDPMACFAAQHLHQRLGLGTVVIIRHPASTIASFKRLGWHYNLEELTSQTELMQRYLEPVLGRLNLRTLTAVQAWSYFWLSIYTVLQDYLQNNPEMAGLTHEALSRQPLSEFEQLYRKFGLPFTAEVRRSITAHTGAHNPSGPKTGAAHSLMRHSQANIHRWKKLLDPEEQIEIRRITEPLAANYYSDADW
jgi:hypothetical protein